jgi:hypothetical protein
LQIISRLSRARRSGAVLCVALSTAFVLTGCPKPPTPNPWHGIRCPAPSEAEVSDLMDSLEPGGAGEAWVSRIYLHCAALEVEAQR